MKKWSCVERKECCIKNVKKKKKRGKVQVQSPCFQETASRSSVRVVTVCFSFELRANSKRPEPPFPCALYPPPPPLLLAKHCSHTFLNSPRLALIGLFQYFPYAGWRNETAAAASQQTFLQLKQAFT